MQIEVLGSEDINYLQEEEIQLGDNLQASLSQVVILEI
jgi:hypothetical protein